jgi:alkylation response protein AidB-like acyl-CoA dehydrogenase
VLIAHGTEGAEAALPAEILAAEEISVPGLLRAQRRLGSGGLRDARGTDGDDFVVNGQKVWTSFARYADWCMLLVRTDPHAPKHKGITFLLVDMHSPGVTVRPLKQISGDEDFNEVFFEDVRVPRGNVVGADERGWDIAITDLMHERQTLTFSRQLQSRVALSAARPGAAHAATARRLAQPLLPQKLAAAVRSTASHALHGAAQPHPRAARRTPGPEGSIEKLFWSEMYPAHARARAVSLTRTVRCAVRGLAARRRRGPWPHLMLYSRAGDDRCRLVRDSTQHHRRARARPAEGNADMTERPTEW